MSLTYFAADGSYGDADGLLVLSTGIWSDKDWQAFEDDPTPENAQRITRERRSEIAGILRDVLRAEDSCPNCGEVSGFGAVLRPHGLAQTCSACGFDEDKEDIGPRRCACVCGCDHKLEGYAPGETVCGACFDNCDAVTP